MCFMFGIVIVYMSMFFFFFLINGERNEDHLFDSECSG